MYMNKKIGCYMIFFLFIFLLSCSNNSVQITELKHYPIDNLDGIISQTGIELDKIITKDETGSLKIIAKEPMTMRLYETGDIDIENARLTY